MNLTRRVVCVNPACTYAGTVRTITLAELDAELYATPTVRCVCGLEVAQVPADPPNRLGALGEQLPPLERFSGIIPGNRLTQAGPVRVGWLRRMLLSNRAASVRIGGQVLTPGTVVDFARDQRLEGYAIAPLVTTLAALRDGDPTGFRTAALLTDPTYTGP